MVSARTLVRLQGIMEEIARWSLILTNPVSENDEELCA